jgi:hypothetical protein
MTTAIAIVLISAASLAAGTMNNSEVWTTTNGAPVIDSEGINLQFGAVFCWKKKKI